MAELDISQGLALAFLALVAVLPEYAVDLYFASKAATHPEYTAYATANMTGANRLLIGIAWPLIVVLYWARSGRRELKLPGSRAVELVFLSLATVYSFVIPLKGTLSLLDTVVFVGLFVAYMWRIARSEAGEPDLVGPALAVAALRPWLRRTFVVVFFVFAAGVILGSAEPFAEALVHLGRRRGIDEFLLVQWLAPLASEAPEIVIACILTLKGDAQAGMGAMVSSKVNQWTLLVGTLPLVYSIALGHPGALHLDARQVEEILLTVGAVAVRGGGAEQPATLAVRSRGARAAVHSAAVLSEHRRALRLRVGVLRVGGRDARAPAQRAVDVPACRAWCTKPQPSLNPTRQQLDEIAKRLRTPGLRLRVPERVS